MYTKNVYKNTMKNRQGHCHVKLVHRSCTLSVELPQAKVSLRYGSD